jgi:alkanesulfonate monooxygenase SsuD/methylene tetrahydromethanopterin reductase-like flavin-dependent oxidoreductase (luciferase family)
LVDALSGGRLELGLGRGFAPADYDRFDLDRRDSNRLFRTHHEKLIDLLGSCMETAKIPIWLATTGSQQTLDLAVKWKSPALVHTWFCVNSRFQCLL